MPELHINVQKQNERFLFETTENTAPTLRVYFYRVVNEVVTDRNLTASETSKFCYFVDRQSTNITEIEGTIVAGVNYVDYDFTGSTANNGRFMASVIIYDVEDIPEVQGDGQINFKENNYL